MTPEARLDRLERVAKSFVKAGARARRQSREQGEKINILINLQMQNEERFARNEERFARTDERFAQLAEAQVSTGRRLDSLIDIIRGGRNGKSQ